MGDEKSQHRSPKKQVENKSWEKGLPLSEKDAIEYGKLPDARPTDISQLTDHDKVKGNTMITLETKAPKLITPKFDFSEAKIERLVTLEEAKKLRKKKEFKARGKKALADVGFHETGMDTNQAPEIPTTAEMRQKAARERMKAALSKAQEKFDDEAVSVQVKMRPLTTQEKIRKAL